MSFVGYYWLGQALTTRDISSHIKDIYGFGISETMVSKITKKILPNIEEYPRLNLSTTHFIRWKEWAGAGPGKIDQ
ncbi:MAG: transposase [Anaerococcus sp.]|nr:transposase [Anaerococcus sp.]MDU1828482.1 transposase [Anaerococcus sp.]